MVLKIAVGDVPPHLWRMTSRKAFDKMLRDKRETRPNMHLPDQKRALEMALVTYAFSAPILYAAGLFGSKKQEMSKCEKPKP